MKFQDVSECFNVHPMHRAAHSCTATPRRTARKARALRFTSWRNGGGFHPGYRGGLLRGLLHDGSVVSASRRNPRDVLGKHRSM